MLNCHIILVTLDQYIMFALHSSIDIFRLQSIFHLGDTFKYFLRSSTTLNVR